LVSNLSEAMSDVDTKEKKSPIVNRMLTKNNIGLSIFFHHW